MQRRLEGAELSLYYGDCSDACLSSTDGGMVVVVAVVVVGVAASASASASAAAAAEEEAGVAGMVVLVEMVAIPPTRILRP